jgi:uncharacterized membrane protein YGL010W
MRSTLDLLAQYAANHRDRRNIATHFLGMPLVVFGVGVLLGRPAIEIGSLDLTPAWLLWAASTIWYLTRGDLVLGVAVSLANAVLLALAQPLAAWSTLAWLAWGGSACIIGWIMLFVGHCYEGRKSATIDDLYSMLVGPMFIAAEALFALGWGKSMLAEIERRAGPTHARDLAAMRS